MSLKTLVDFCIKYSINMEYVEFWYGHKEVYAIFGKGSIEGIPYPGDNDFEDWYQEDSITGLVSGLPEENFYISFNRDYDALAARID